MNVFKTHTLCTISVRELQGFYTDEVTYGYYVTKKLPHKIKKDQQIPLYFNHISELYSTERRGKTLFVD